MNPTQQHNCGQTLSYSDDIAGDNYDEYGGVITRPDGSTISIDDTDITNTGTALEYTVQPNDLSVVGYYLIQFWGESTSVKKYGGIQTLKVRANL